MTTSIVLSGEPVAKRPDSTWNKETRRPYEGEIQDTCSFHQEDEDNDDETFAKKQVCTIMTNDDGVDVDVLKYHSAKDGMENSNCAIAAKEE